MTGGELIFNADHIARIVGIDGSDLLLDAANAVPSDANHTNTAIQDGSCGIYVRTAATVRDVSVGDLATYDHGFLGCGVCIYGNHSQSTYANNANGAILEGLDF